MGEDESTPTDIPAPDDASGAPEAPVPPAPEAELPEAPVAPALPAEPSPPAAPVGYAPPPPPAGYAPPPPVYAPPSPQYVVATAKPPKEKLVAGLLALLLGGLGVHKFYLGYTTEGIIHVGIYITVIAIAGFSMGVCFPVAFIPSTIALIEGIIYLTKSDEDFYQTYVVNKKGWF